jgi:hypothetical protein
MIKIRPGEEKYSYLSWVNGNYLVKVSNFHSNTFIHYVKDNDNLISSILELAQRLIPFAGEKSTIIEQKLKTINPNIKLNYQLGKGRGKITVDILDLGYLGKIRNPSNEESTFFSEINADNFESYHRFRLTSEIFDQYVMNHTGDVTYVPDDKSVTSILKNAKHLFNVYSNAQLNSMIVTLHDMGDIITIARKTKNNGLSYSSENNIWTYGEKQAIPINDRCIQLYNSKISHMQEYPDISARCSQFYFKRKSVIVDSTEEGFYWNILENAIKNCTSVGVFNFFDDIPNGMTRKKNLETNDWFPNKDEFLHVAKDYLMIK